jgi:hypothetical protein
MPSSLEYHVSVRHLIAVSLALFSLLALSATFVSTSHAQINGTPASVTSPGFGGRAINGPPASVTSLGPRGYAPNSRVTFSMSNAPRSGNDHHRRHHHVDYFPPLAYAVPVPYAVDIVAADGSTDGSNYDDDDASPDDRDPNYQGGPTIFDRRGSGAASYIPPVSNLPRPRALQSADLSSVDPEPPQAPTLLVFKDGRKLEVGNYAIIGATLFDLTPGHARKIALADLDLEATLKENDDRGVTFQIPSAPQAN